MGIIPIVIILIGSIYIYNIYDVHIAELIKSKFDVKRNFQTRGTPSVR